MQSYTQEELTEALQAVESIIHKCEKAQEKFQEGSTHHTLLRNRLKPMYISKSLMEERLSVAMPTNKSEVVDSTVLLLNLDKLHTTDLGVQRIQRNLKLDTSDIVGWFMEKIKAKNSSITRKGKNWYIVVDSCEITVNIHSYTIITAHKC